MKYLLILLISVSGIHSAAVAAEGGGSCSKLFQGSANPAEALDQLSKLPPLLLDLANPKEALRRLIEEIVELRTDFITLRGIKESLSDPNADLNSIRNVLDQLASSYAAEALELLSSKSSFSDKERKILEGYKILIKSALQLKNEIDNIEQERQRQKEEQAQNQQNQQGQDQQQKNSDQKNDQQKNQQQKQDPKNNQGKDQKKEEPPQDLKDLQERLDQLRKELDKQSEQKDSKDQKQQEQDKNSQDKKQDQKDSNPKSEEDMIKELEKQVQDLEKRLEQEEQKSQSDQKQQSQKQDSQKQDQKSQKQDSQKQDKQSQQQDPQQKQDSQESQSEQKESQENQNQEQQSQQQKENSQSKEEQQKQREEAVEKLKEKLDELKKELEEKQKQKEEQQQKGEKQDQKQDSKEESKEESQEQSEQQQEGQQGGQKQESQEQGQQGQEGQQQGQPQQQGQGQQKSQQQGERQGHKSEQQGQEGQQSEQSSEGQSQSESQSQSQKDGQSQSKESDGQSKSSGKGESSLSPLEKLSEMLKSLRDDKDEKDGKPTQEDKKPSDQETKNADKEFNEQDLKDQREQKDSKDQKSDSRRKKPRSLKDPKELKTIDDIKKMEALKHHLDMLWIETIRNYENREDLMSAISYFQNTCRKLSTQYKADFLKRYAEVASELYEKLDTYQVEYKSLEQLGLSMISSLADSNTGIQRKLKYVNEILSTLEKLTSLTAEEDRVLQAVRKLLSHTESKERSVDDKELGEMFLSQMAGPLSKSALKKQFPSTDPKEEMNWKLFAQAIRAGSLNDLILNSRTKQLLNIFNKNILKPRFYKKNQGPEVPINEADPELETARELDRAQRFYRDGAPPKDDLIKLLSGDMLESTYKDEVQRSDPKTPVPKVVTIMVYDVSGSMSSDNKYVLRNALMNSYLDKSQIEVVQGKAEHVIYMIAFDGRAHEAERVGSLQQAQKYFEQARQRPAGNGSSTDITSALVSVYENIAKHQKEGGELDRANILLITDAEDSIKLDRVAEARKLVSPDVEVVLNAITMGSNNADVQKLVRPENSQGDKAIHQHIPTEQLEKLLDVNKKLVSILEEAKSFNKDMNTAFSNQTLLVLKNYLSSLATKNAMKDNASAVGTQFALRYLETKSVSESQEVSAAMEVFVDMMSGPLARNWSAAKKASVLENYVNQVAKTFDVDVESIYLQMPQNLKAQVLRWIQN